MSSCCQSDYEEVFDEKSANEEMEKYLTEGVKRSSRPLVSLLNELSLEGCSLLDIGGGVGIISFESLSKGLRTITHVDISSAHITAFIREIGRREVAIPIEALKGNFVDIADTIQPADLVTLDKVICCYQDYVSLVNQSVQKARKWYLYTIPRDVWWVKCVHGTEQVINRIMGKSFRSYIHSEAKIEQLVTEAGFQWVDTRYQREWKSILFERV